MFAGKETIWISSDRKTKLFFDRGAVTLGLYVNDVLALSLGSTGINTFSLMPRIPINANVVAVGTNQATAAALLEGFQTVSAADGAVGVRLPTAVAGAQVIIKGTTSAVLKVYPASGAQINAVGADTAMSLASGVIPAIFLAVSTTLWYTIPLLPS